jgi:hypothetical protein
VRNREQELSGCAAIIDAHLSCSWTNRVQVASDLTPSIEAAVPCSCRDRMRLICFYRQVKSDELCRCAS